MAKWSEKHMYNWVGWIDSVANTYTKINEWTVRPTSPLGFLVFTLNITLGSIIMGFITGLMSILQSFECIMKGLMTWVDKTIDTNKNPLIQMVALSLALFVLIPYAFTWGLPKLIMEHREKKRLERLQAFQTTVNEDIRRWDDINDRVIRVRRELVRDFTPKMKLKAHRMVEPRTLTTGNYSIAIGYGNIARGNHSISPWPRDVTITTHTEGGVSTAMITDNMT